MHSNRMRTARSSSRHGGLHPPGSRPPLLEQAPPPGAGPPPPRAGTPPVWAWRPPQARPLNFPLGCGPGDPPGQTTQLPPWVWAWKPARHAGIPPGDLLQGMLGYHLQCMLGYPTPPVDRHTRVKHNLHKLCLRAVIKGHWVCVYTHNWSLEINVVQVSDAISFQWEFWRSFKVHIQKLLVHRVCIMIHVSANFHYAKMTSGVFLLVVIGYFSKQTMWIVFIVNNGHICNVL